MNEGIKEGFTVMFSAFSPILTLLAVLGGGMWVARKAIEAIPNTPPSPPAGGIVSNYTGWDDDEEEEEDTEELYQNRPRRNRFKRLGIKR